MFNVYLQVVVGDNLPRVFNSPYSANASLDYNPIHRMSTDYRVGRQLGTHDPCFTFGLLPLSSYLQKHDMYVLFYPHRQRQSGLSPATSEINLFPRSTSPVAAPVSGMVVPRTRFSTYESMLRRRAELNNPVRSPKL